jgi:hypothetical protein
LGIPEIVQHSGMAVANQILAVLSTFSINPSQIGYFTLDNVESNITAMVAIGTAL